MRVIGLDPGLRRTGWGVVDVAGARLSHVAHGVCRSDDAAELGARLAQLFRQLEDVFAAHAPDAAAVEQTFVNRDPQSALRLGQARGVAMLVPALFDLPVAEYAPSAVKKAVVGAGRAEKEQVQHMVAILAPGAKGAPADAADALAVAICHAYAARSAAAVASSLAKSGAARGRRA